LKRRNTHRAQASAQETRRTYFSPRNTIGSQEDDVRGPLPDNNVAHQNAEEDEIDWEAESSFFDDPNDNCPSNINAADEPSIIRVVPDALVGGCD
jgi:hypothetical protein